MAEAVSGGVGDGVSIGLDHHFQVDAGTAAVFAVAAAIGPEFVGAEMQREAGLGHFDAAELQAARRVPLAGVVPAIAAGGRAAAGPGMEQVPDEGFAVARVLALNGDAQAPPPARHGFVGAGFGQRHDDRFDDFVGAVAGAHGDGLAVIRPHNRALLGDHLSARGMRPQFFGMLGSIR